MAWHGQAFWQVISLTDWDSSIRDITFKELDSQAIFKLDFKHFPYFKRPWKYLQLDMVKPFARIYSLKAWYLSINHNPHGHPNNFCLSMSSFSYENVVFDWQSSTIKLESLTISSSSFPYLHIQPAWRSSSFTFF